jgi:hypothetical protein
MPAGATYEPIATTTLGSANSTIEFTTISGSYTDIKCILFIPSSTATSNIRVRFNSDSGTNYLYTYLEGTGSSAGTGRYTSSTYLFELRGSTSDTLPTLVEFDVFSYAGSTKKTVLVKNSLDRNGSGQVERMVCLWRSTSAITTITLTSSSSTWVTGTRATLYGIKNSA